MLGHLSVFLYRLLYDFVAYDGVEIALKFIEVTHKACTDT